MTSRVSNQRANMQGRGREKEEERKRETGVQTDKQTDRVLVTFVSYRRVTVRTSNETSLKVYSRPNLPNNLT
jgi:hypothetical protein